MISSVIWGKKLADVLYITRANRPLLFNDTQPKSASLSSSCSKHAVALIKLYQVCHRHCAN